LLTKAGINKTFLKFCDPVFEMDLNPLTLDPNSLILGFRPAKAASCLPHLSPFVKRGFLILDKNFFCYIIQMLSTLTRSKK
jgi:hypothetical protein